MRNCILILALFCFTVVGFAQENNKVKTEKKGDLVEATYFYENGQIEQSGTFNSEGKLHGEWTSYDLKGNKVAVGKYLNGQKVGKWFFWTKDSLKEVDYIDSKIASVSEWTDKTRVALRNK